MALVADEVRVAISGELLSAPRGTAAPTNASDPLDPAFKGHGYVSEDGVTENWDDSTDNIVAWQNAVTVRAARTESTLTLACTLIQTRGSNLEFFYPGSQVEANGGEWKIDVKPPTSDPRAFVLNVLDGTDLIRIYVGNAELTERGEVMYQNGEPIGYPVTVTAYPDDDGNLMTKFSNSAAWGIDIS
ncbi:MULTISPECIES: phage tail protein [unclassified Streptomyces]|uniref:phage tail tube protein n=1 Tax=unclassified Streptomyces TaxID=2593676 RepID=UPI0014893138|nr:MULTISPECIES: phage tail protein [unclassified Streptomyces]